jgi:hypothetical protein
VHYVISENLLPRDEDKMRNAKGLVPAKAIIPFDDYHKFAEIPGLYEVGFTHSVNSKGKAQIVPAAFKFLGTLEIVNKSADFRKSQASLGQASPQEFGQPPAGFSQALPTGFGQVPPQGFRQVQTNYGDDATID